MRNNRLQMCLLTFPPRFTDPKSIWDTTEQLTEDFVDLGDTSYFKIDDDEKGIIWVERNWL
jgi:hypothetical protein